MMLKNPTKLDKLKDRKAFLLEELTKLDVEISKLEMLKSNLRGQFKYCVPLNPFVKF